MGSRTNAILAFLAAMVLVGAAYAYWDIRVIHAGADAENMLLNVDPYVIFHPVMARVQQRVLAGELPLWNPHQLCGIPILATQYPGILYPGNLAYLLLPTREALSVTLWAHLALNGLFLFAFARALRLPISAALFGALAFMFSGFALYTPMANNHAVALAWTPAAFLATEKILQGRHALWAAALGFVLAMPILGGNSQFLVYTLYGMGVYVLFRIPALLREGPSHLRRALVLLVVGGVLGVSFSAAQWLPTMELLRQGTRSLRRLALDELVPFSVLGHLTPGELALFFIQQKINLCLLVWIGALAALPLLAGRPAAAALLLGGLVGLDFSLSDRGFLFKTYMALPGIQAFRVPERFLLLTVLGAAMLSAIALGRIVEGRDRRTRAWPAAFGALGGLVLAMQQSGDERTLALVGSAIMGFIWLPPRFWRALLVVALAGYVGWSEAKASTYWKNFPAREGATEVLYGNKAVFDELRIFYPWGRSILVRPLFSLSLIDKSGTLFNFPVLQDYEPLAPQIYARYFKEVLDPGYRTPGRLYMGWIPPERLRHPRMLDYLSFRYLIVENGSYPYGDPASYFPRLRPMDGRINRGPSVSPVSGNVKVWENLAALPHAYVASEAVFLPSPDAVLRAMASTPAATKHVFLEGRPGIARAVAGENDRAEVIEDSPEEIRVRASAKGGGWLVLTDLHYPGWVAEVDGTPAAILRANYLLRAVRLEPGTHEVRFAYKPRSFLVGLVWTFSALAAVALWILLAALGRWRRGRVDRTERSILSV